MNKESVEPDYDSAAEAWFHMEYAMLMLRHRDELYKLISEFRRKEKLESSCNR